MKPTLQTLPPEILHQILDHVNTPAKPAQRQTNQCGSQSPDPALAANDRHKLAKSGSSFRARIQAQWEQSKVFQKMQSWVRTPSHVNTPTNPAREPTSFDLAQAATQDRYNLAKSSDYLGKINADWEASKVTRKMESWVKNVSPADVADALARSGTSIAPENMEEVTKQVRSFFDEIRTDPTFNEQVKYYVLKDVAGRKGTDEHPLKKREGYGLAGYLPKPYDTQGASQHIRESKDLRSTTNVFGKTIDLGKDKIHILLGYTRNHWGDVGRWEMDIINSQRALKTMPAF